MVEELQIMAEKNMKENNRQVLVAEDNILMNHNYKAVSLMIETCSMD